MTLVGSSRGDKLETRRGEGGGGWMDGWAFMVAHGWWVGSRCIDKPKAPCVAPHATMTIIPVKSSVLDLSHLSVRRGTLKWPITRCMFILKRELLLLYRQHAAPSLA